MTRTRFLRGCFGLIAIAALLVPAVAVVQATVPPLAPVKQDTNPSRTLYATTSDNKLLTFSAMAPQTASSKAITGLPTGVTLVGIDTRPASGDLYGIGSDSVVYRVNPMTAIAVAEAPAFSPALFGRFFGVDFNPTVDRIRVTSDFDQNLRLHPDDGNVVAVDGALNPGEPTVVGSAYTNSSFTAFNGPNRATSTILYALDAGDDTLCVQNPPNAGTLVNCKDLRINVRGNTGFEIVGNMNSSSDTNVGYVATTDPVFGGSALYRLDLGNANTVRVGRVLVQLQAQTVTGLAAVQDQR
jgi:hypothetical protein